MKILFFNVGYCVDADGSFREYLLRFHRFFFQSKRRRRAYFARLARTVDRANPDLFCFAEGYCDPAIHDVFRKFPFGDMAFEYTDSLRRVSPLFRKRCNGFLAKKDLRFRTRRFARSHKNLVYEIALGKDTVLFLVHFSLFRHVRRRQFTQLAGWVKRHTNAIVCGDLNLFHGDRDLQSFLKTTGLRLAGGHTLCTFPSHKPHALFDVFLCSPRLHINDLRVLPDSGSDHRPVLLSVDLPV